MLYNHILFWYVVIINNVLPFNNFQSAHLVRKYKLYSFHGRRKKVRISFTHRTCLGLLATEKRSAIVYVYKYTNKTVDPSHDDGLYAFGLYYAPCWPYCGLRRELMLFDDSICTQFVAATALPGYMAFYELYGSWIVQLWIIPIMLCLSNVELM